MPDERDDEMNEVVMDNGEYSSPEEEIEALRQKLEEREEQLSKAVDFGQTILKKNKNLETFTRQLTEQKKNVENQLEDALNSKVFLEKQLSNTEQAFSTARKERNQLKLQVDGLQNQIKGLVGDSETHKRVLDNNTKLRKRVSDLETEVENLKKLLKFTNSDGSGKEAMNESPLSPRTPRTTVQSDEVQKLEKKYKQEIENLKQENRTIQSERDIAHIQHRVQIKELRRELDETKRELATMAIQSIEEVSDPVSHQYMAHIRGMSMTLSRLKRETTAIRNEYIERQAEISKMTMEATTVMSGIFASYESQSGNSTEEGDRSLEMSYALLQARVIQELGLDDYYTSYGHKQVYPNKEGYLAIASSWFSSPKRYVKASIGGLSFYSSDTDSKDQPLSRFSLIGAKLVPMPSKNDRRFDIKLVPGKILAFEARDSKLKEEWVSFFRNLLKKIDK